MSIHKKEVELRSEGKLIKAYLAAPENGGPGVLVLPSWWGLKPYFRQVCDQLAERGYVALALDYYLGRVGGTIEEAQTLQQEVEGDPEVMGTMVQAAKDHLVSLRRDRPIGIIGFSMGTDWAIITAAKAPAIAAVVLFYGCYGVDFSQMKAKVLGHFAERDEWQPLENIQQVEREMKADGVDVVFHVYPGAAHWFMEPDRPEYDPAAAKLAWSRTLEFLAMNLT